MTQATERYARLALIPGWRQDILQGATILVAGAGAVGNEVIKNLALLGVGRIIILDKDTIEETNLTRSVLFRHADIGQTKAAVAARRAQELDPAVEAIPVVADLVDVGLGLVAAADVVISCFDSIYGRVLLNRFCARLGTPWINGGLGDASSVFKGVLTVFHAPEGPCFECLLPPGRGDRELVARLSRGGCGEAAQAAKELGAVPSTPTMASILGALQVQEALKILHTKHVPNEEEAALPVPAWGTITQYFTDAHTVVGQRAKPASHCVLHDAPNHRSLADYSRTQPLRAVWELAGLPDDALVALPGPVVRSIDCVRCGQAVPVMCCENRSGDVCPTCGGQGRPDTFCYVARDDAEAAQSLADFQFPPASHLRLLAERETILTWPGMLDEVRHEHR